MRLNFHSKSPESTQNLHTLGEHDETLDRDMTAFTQAVRDAMSGKPPVGFTAEEWDLEARQIMREALD